MKLSPELYTYLFNNSLREPSVLTELREETKKLDIPMQISPEQGQFMQLLIKLLNAEKTLDIGVFTGYSSLAVALALPSQGQVIACDINENWTAMAKQFWKKAGVSNKVSLKLQPAIKTLDELLNQNQENSFDFAFIDADKTSYLEYYERSLLLIRPGGVIAIDNVLWGGRVADPLNKEVDTIAIRNLNAHIINDERVDISMLTIGDGLTLAMKK